MKKKYLYAIIILELATICSILAQNVNPIDIDNLIVQSSDLPNGFLLFQERVARVGDFSNEQVFQIWKRGSQEQDLELIEEKIQSLDHAVGASSFQKWYRGETRGNRDKLEIDIIICQSESDMEKTIFYFTKEAYSAKFEGTTIPLAGEYSWKQKYLLPEQESFSVMFKKYNVFVRIYIRIKELNADELFLSTTKLLETIDNKIEL